MITVKLHVVKNKTFIAHEKISVVKNTCCCICLELKLFVVKNICLITARFGKLFIVKNVLLYSCVGFVYLVLSQCSRLKYGIITST